jgi:hypothetical protein
MFFFSKTKMIGKFIFYIPQFCKNIWSAKFFAKLYISAVGTASGTYRRAHGEQPVRLAGGWWLVLICSERKVLLADC